jgi:GDP-L-fucose synthase
MNKEDKIYVAGHNGLVGSSIVSKLQDCGYTNLIMQSHQTLDLSNQSDVADFFLENKPKHVILSAAKVGGIFANSTYPADFIYQNIMIQSNVIHSSYVNNVNKLIFLGSSCIYPREVKQPMTENALLTGMLEPSNEPYAIAKIAGIKLCESFNRQHNTDFRSIMPTNLYGINDSFNSDSSHVIPALISRIHDAKINNKPEVVVWGTGNAMREFMHVDDLADAVFFILRLNKVNYQEKIDPMMSHLNIGTGLDVKISELAYILKDLIDYKGNIIFDSQKPDGPPRKLIDNSKLTKMGWKSKISLKDGLEATYKWYVKSLDFKKN